MKIFFCDFFKELFERGYHHYFKIILLNIYFF